MAEIIATTFFADPSYDRNQGVGIGYQVPVTNGISGCIFIGPNSGTTSTGQYVVAIGSNAGTGSMSGASVAIGGYCGSSQGEFAIAVGYTAGQNSQVPSAVAIGYKAGQNTQSDEAVAVGDKAGENSQGEYSVAVGCQAGQTSQGYRAVAVGFLAGAHSQGNYSVAIGSNAGENNQPANSIVINATGSELDGALASSTYINPIRSGTGTTPTALSYDTTTFEVFTSTDPLVVPGIYNNQTPVSVSGSTSGNILWVQTDYGTALNKIMIYCDALVGTATITFGTPFTYTPQIITTDGPAAAVVTSLSTTGATITGATTTGFIILEGF
jgi:hypothetical protein